MEVPRNEEVTEPRFSASRGASNRRAIKKEQDIILYSLIRRSISCSDLKGPPMARNASWQRREATSARDSRAPASIAVPHHPEILEGHTCPRRRPPAPLHPEKREVLVDDHLDGAAHDGEATHGYSLSRPPTAAVPRFSPCSIQDRHGLSASQAEVPNGAPEAAKCLRVLCRFIGGLSETRTRSETRDSAALLPATAWRRLSFRWSRGLGWRPSSFPCPAPLGLL